MISKTSWIDRFGAHLLRCQSEITPLSAAAIAIDSYFGSCDLEPEQAAERRAIEIKKTTSLRDGSALPKRKEQ
jgi:hypothetical protein